MKKSEIKALQKLARKKSSNKKGKRVIDERGKMVILQIRLRTRA